MATMPLTEVDKVEILTFLDNTIDLLLRGNNKVKRLPVPPDAFERESLVAEHGFAALVTVTSGNTSESFVEVVAIPG
jgi:7,8-dihydropterin-6-yl-methyl-4-(beta-D-ribofuranosyl)aminobenzene 5'-phosphate synthase